MAISPGATLRKLRARKPLVHQITNYVVMNETANATLALGALPVMAHAPQEVEEMAANAGALVLNIGTLSEHWIEAMLLAGKAAKGPIVLDPVGAGATRYRTETAKRLLAELDIAVVRGNAAEIATLVGSAAEIRGVESISVVSTTPDLVRDAARTLGTIVSLTGPTDHVSGSTDNAASVATVDGVMYAAPPTMPCASVSRRNASVTRVATASSAHRASAGKTFRLSQFSSIPPGSSSPTPSTNRPRIGCCGTCVCTSSNGGIITPSLARTGGPPSPPS